ncbi:MAG: NADH-quinone oxidoreductase subunit L [Bdellovibrionales bacterium]|nr:NADH-quinone oxidoreductase subunit L [Bdellovibrionales bacterium]
MSASLYIAILLLAPLVGFLINGLNWKGKNGVLAGMIASGAIGVSFLMSIMLFFQVKGMPHDARTIFANFFEWMTVGSLSIAASFVVDQISAIMILIITGVGLLIHIFSISYMSHDARPTKYFAYLNLFVFNMLILVLGSNLPVMFVGWEGVGLCSYLLIGFWFKDVEKANAGMKAFIANRVGDAGLLLGMFVIWKLFGTLEFSKINALSATSNSAQVIPITIATLLLFVGATGKSAQIPLYVWLPDAMAGPTPVSALIHAATMVTAGVYMICRLSFLFIAAPMTMNVIAVIGALTALMAASIGLAQWDIKKVLAYSTVSQLGYMFLACGVGAFNAAMFHLMTHAFFKALMFLGSGSVIHAMDGEQDIRKMGGLKKHLPITYLTFLMGWFAILGTPLFSGFFSKDEILWMAFHSPRGNAILWCMGVCGAAMTAFYMTRLMALTFWGKSRVPASVHPHESPASMTFPLIVLAVLSVIGGWIGIPHVIGHPLHLPNLFEHWLEPMLAKIPNLQEGKAWVEVLLMVVSVSLAAASAYLAYVMYVVNPETMPRQFAARMKQGYSLVLNKFWVDEMYGAAIIRPIVDLSRGLWVFVDVNFIDKATYWVSDFVKSAGDGSRGLQTGNLQTYALYVTLGVVFLTMMILI